MSCKSYTFSGLLDLGCFFHCGELELPLIACETGMHVFIFSNNGAKFTQEVFALEGENFKVDNHFNECSETSFQVIKPDGNLLKIDTSLDENQEDCKSDFCFRTVIGQHKIKLTSLVTC